jgi:hypothetical protein
MTIEVALLKETLPRSLSLSKGRKGTDPIQKKTLLRRAGYEPAIFFHLFKLR